MAKAPDTSQRAPMEKLTAMTRPPEEIATGVQSALADTGRSWASDSGQPEGHVTDRGQGRVMCRTTGMPRKTPISLTHAASVCCQYTFGL